MSSKEKPPFDGFLPLTPSKTTRAFRVTFRLTLCSSQDPVTPPTRRQQLQTLGPRFGVQPAALQEGSPGRAEAVLTCMKEPFPVSGDSNSVIVSSSDSL